MNRIAETADPTAGVAQVSVATSFGKPGGRVLTAADVPELLRQGKSVEELAALGLMDREGVEQMAFEMAQGGKIPSEHGR